MLFLGKILKLRAIRTSKRRCKETHSKSFALILLKKSRIILHLLSFLYILLLSSALFSQNLVPNPSFEEEINFQNTDPSNWIKCLKNDTPDHFFLDESKPGSFNKNRFFGGTEPYDGNSSAGIFCYRVNPLRGTADVREFIQIQLKEIIKHNFAFTLVYFIPILCI